MKKVLALAAAAALLLSISACGVDVGTVSGSDGTTSDAILSSVPGEESQTGEESQAPAKDPEEIEAEVDDNLTGLCSFLVQTGGVGGDPVDMAADFIGAVAGVQYRFSYEGSNNVTVELYEYDLDNLNDEAQAVLDSVNANGTFTVIGQEVTDAYLSDSGKYLMIYKDTQTNEQNELHKQEIVEQFQGFKAEYTHMGKEAVVG